MSPVALKSPEIAELSGLRPEPRWGLRAQAWPWGAIDGLQTHIKISGFLTITPWHVWLGHKQAMVACVEVASMSIPAKNFFNRFNRQ